MSQFSPKDTSEKVASEIVVQPEEAGRRFAAYARRSHARLFLSLVAYMDESYDNAALVIGGWVGLDWQWEGFCRKWQWKLSEHQAPYLHMREVSEDGVKDPESGFYGWNRDEVDSLVYDMIPIARDFPLFGVAACFDLPAYRAEMHPKLQAEWFDPIVFGFQMFVDEVLRVVDEHPFGPPLAKGETIDLVFDIQDEHRGHLEDGFAELLKAKNLADRFEGLAFRNSKKYLPLQAADLLANRFHKVFVRKLEEKAIIKPESWDDELQARGNLFTPYYTRAEFQAFMDEMKGKYPGQSNAN